MSDADRRLRIVAVAFAGVAMLVAMIAVVIVVRRDSPASASASAKSAEPVVAHVAPLTDHKVLATDVMKLQHGSVEVVVGGGQTKGVRVKDPALATALGLEPDDVITSVSGRPVLRELDVYDAMFNVSMMNATIVYAEILRANTPALIRWQLDGDLRKARYGASGSTLGLLGSFTPSVPPPPPDPDDPLLDTIERVDDTHVRIPRKTVDHVLANPMASMKGARVVPAMRNGQPDGFKLYAIRPSSGFAKLGFQNGDTLQTINGTKLTSADKALEVYVQLKDAKIVTIEMVRRGQPMSLTITITK